MTMTVSSITAQWFHSNTGVILRALRPSLCDRCNHTDGIAPATEPLRKPYRRCYSPATATA